MAGKDQSISNLLTTMEGLIVALATPLAEDGKLDIDGLERLIERVIEGGASCLFPLGWCGEQPLLTRSVNEAMMRETCRIAAGRLPVMVGVSEQSIPKALELAALARKAGADLLLATPPYSYPIPQELIYNYFKELASQSNRPLVIYQNDELGVRVELETMVRLSEIPGLIGVKAYVPFVELQRYFHRAHKPGQFSVISGDEYLFGAALLLGIRHFTMGGPGNFSPGWCTGIYRSALEADWEAVREKQKKLTDFCDAVYFGVDSAYAAVKYILERLNICSARISSPHRILPSEQKKKIDAAIEEFRDILA